VSDLLGDEQDEQYCNRSIPFFAEGGGVYQFFGLRRFSQNRYKKNACR